MLMNFVTLLMELVYECDMNVTQNLSLRNVKYLRIVHDMHGYVSLFSPTQDLSTLTRYLVSSRGSEN
jgi:hypothetical protein